MAETVAAQPERFSEWVWEDPDRAADLARTYNGRFNSIVLRSYDDARLSLPGLALTFKPHRYQVAAVARIIAEPAVGLYHEVGAGQDRRDGQRAGSSWCSAPSCQRSHRLHNALDRLEKVCGHLARGRGTPANLVPDLGCRRPTVGAVP
jgi:N12 class adenine-specific DNA methylase